MKKNVYILINQNLEVWDCKDSALRHYQELYNKKSNSNCNVKYKEIIRQINLGREIIKPEVRNCRYIIDYSSDYMPLERGRIINLCGRYSADKTMKLWETKYKKIKCVSLKYKVNLSSLTPFERFNEEDYEKFYKELLEEFNYKVDSFKIHNLHNKFGSYLVLINDSIRTFFHYTDGYERIVKMIDNVCLGLNEKDNKVKQVRKKNDIVK